MTHERVMQLLSENAAEMAKHSRGTDDYSVKNVMAYSERARGDQIMSDRGLRFGGANSRRQERWGRRHNTPCVA